MTDSQTASLPTAAVTPDPLGLAGDIVAGDNTAVVQEGLYHHHYVGVLFESGVCQLSKVGPEATYVG